MTIVSHIVSVKKWLNTTGVDGTKNDGPTHSENGATE